MERENEVKKLKAIDSLLIEESFSDQLRDYNFNRHVERHENSQVNMIQDEERKSERRMPWLL